MSNSAWELESWTARSRESIKETESPTSTVEIWKERRTTDLSAQEPLYTTINTSPRSVHGIPWVVVTVTILSTVFVYSMDNTIVALIQPRILNTLGHIELLPWIQVGFSIVAVSMNLTWGKLFSQFNGKTLFCFFVFIFMVGSAVCGAAPSMNAFIVGRALTGVGGSGIYMGGIMVLSALTDAVERPMYISYVGMMWCLGTSLGPIIGGVFADSSATWRWGFYLNLCVGAVIAPPLLLKMPSYDPRPGVPIKQRLRELDWVSMVLLVGAIASLLIAISFGGSRYPWSGGQIIGSFVCSGVLWLLFILQQIFCLFTTREHRLFPVAFLKDWEMCVQFVNIACSMSVLFIPIFMTPLYFQFVRSADTLEAAVHLLPFVILTAAAMMVNGALGVKLGWYMPWYLVGSILVVIGAALLQTISQTTSTSKMYGYIILIAVGVGSYGMMPFSVAQAKVDPAQAPAARAFIGFGQMLGASFSVAVANSVFINRATVGIRHILPEESLGAIQAAIAGVSGSIFEKLSREEKKEVLDAIVAAIKDVFVMPLTMGAATLVLSLAMKRERLVAKVEK
ncbi:putative MFS drug efflux transporter [Lophium mytilinum]|uniref:Putative MFS drug efflux transporter n=1 Tax=Lophium mytilinum TaxID=390894 RepID=A0A6A6R5L2_9PEZI|nr:putative MFS drug efflux transporter [Lophium mytilinum]